MMSSGQMRSFDEMIFALANVQRRRLLVTLLERDDGETSSAVADGGRAADAERLVEMQHVHLPKLAEYGFIEWDRESDEVRRGEAFAELRPLLVLLADNGNELPDDWL